MSTSTLLTLLSGDSSVESLQQHSSWKAVLATCMAVLAFVLISFVQPDGPRVDTVAARANPAQVAMQSPIPTPAENP